MPGIPLFVGPSAGGSFFCAPHNGGGGVKSHPNVTFEVTFVTQDRSLVGEIGPIG